MIKFHCLKRQTMLDLVQELDEMEKRLFAVNLSLAGLLTSVNYFATSSNPLFN